MAGKLKKICIHWTGGSYQTLNLDHYHFVVDKVGNVHKGLKPPEANVPKNGVSLSPQPESTYVPHCGGGNSFCIGIAMTGMFGYKSRANVGEYPLTAAQCEATWSKVAELCHQYDIAVTPDTVFTHMEFGKKNPKSRSSGKIDINYLPYQAQLRPDEIGDFIRGKVKWYLSKLQGASK